MPPFVSLRLRSRPATAPPAPCTRSPSSIVQGGGVLCLLGLGAAGVCALVSPVPILLSALGAVVPYTLDTLGQAEGYVPVREEGGDKGPWVGVGGCGLV
jgi:hypothetical protein